MVASCGSKSWCAFASDCPDSCFCNGETCASQGICMGQPCRMDYGCGSGSFCSASDSTYTCVSNGGCQDRRCTTVGGCEPYSFCSASTPPIPPVCPTVAVKIGSAEWMSAAAQTAFVEKPEFTQMRFLVSPTTVAKVCRVQIFRAVGQTVFAQPIELALPTHSPAYPITRARACHATMMRVADQIANAPVSRVCRFLQMSSQLSILY